MYITYDPKKGKKIKAYQPNITSSNLTAFFSHFNITSSNLLNLRSKAEPRASFCAPPLIFFVDL